MKPACSASLADASLFFSRPQHVFVGLLYLMSLAISSAAMAATVKRADLTFSGRAYHYRFDSEIAATVARVKAVVADINQLARLNDDIITSQLLERYDAHSFKRRLLLKHCILVFCFDLNFVERVEVLPSGDITTHIIPGESNFRRGDAIWRMVELDAERTLVTMEADQEPDFWIPPIIGPLLIKHSFVREVAETVDKLERLANAPQ